MVSRFCTPPEVKFDAFGTSKHREWKSIWKYLFCYSYQYIVEIHCGDFISHIHLIWNQHFTHLGLKLLFLSLYTTWNEQFAHFKWNQHPCCHALMSNQHFNLLRPEIDIFELTRCVKWTFCPFLSEINILAVAGLHEINILTYLGLKLPFLSLRTMWNELFGRVEVKSTSLLSCLNVKPCKVNIWL